MTRRLIALLAALATALSPALVSAQTESGPIASAAFSAAVLDSETSPSLSGFFGYRFNRVFGMGVEVMWVPEAGDDDGGDFYILRGPDDESSVLLFTTNVRLEVPTTSRRVLPFVTGGGGVASIRREFSAYPLVLPAEILSRAEAYSLMRSSMIRPGPYIFPPPYANTTTGLALTLGGGASFSLTSHLSADVELRYIHIRGNESSSIGRFGGGISARF